MKAVPAEVSLPAVTEKMHVGSVRRWAQHAEQGILRATQPSRAELAETRCYGDPALKGEAMVELADANGSDYIDPAFLPPAGFIRASRSVMRLG